MNIELDKTKDELATATSQLKLEQDLNARIREQLASIGDDKERNASENKALKTNLNELVAKYEEVCFQLERSDEALKKWKMDAEILGEKLRAGTERAENIEKEKKKWAERARQAEEDQTRIEAELHDARNDLTSLRRELLESERLRTDLEAKIENLIARADAAENKKSILENQLDSQREEFLREMSLATERVEIITEDLNHTRYLAACLTLRLLSSHTELICFKIPGENLKRPSRSWNEPKLTCTQPRKCTWKLSIWLNPRKLSLRIFRIIWKNFGTRRHLLKSWKRT